LKSHSTAIKIIKIQYDRCHNHSQGISISYRVRNSARVIELGLVLVFNCNSNNKNPVQSWCHNRSRSTDAGSKQLWHRNYGTFVPKNFCSLVLSLPGTFVPRSKSDMELSLPGTFIPWNFCSLELSLPYQNYLYLHDQLMVFLCKAYYFFVYIVIHPVRTLTQAY